MIDGRRPREERGTGKEKPPQRGATRTETSGGVAASRRPKRQPKKGEQLTLTRTGGWGGRRRGAGRKRADAGLLGSRSGSRVVHAKRPVHKGRHPVHVTLRAKAGLPSFRQQRVQRLLADVLREQRRLRYKDDFRVVYDSSQRNPTDIGGRVSCPWPLDESGWRGEPVRARAGCAVIEQRLCLLVRPTDHLNARCASECHAAPVTRGSLA